MQAVMNPTARFGLALTGSIVILGIGLNFYTDMSMLVCSLPSYGYGVCVTTHPVWPLVISLFPLALVISYLMRRVLDPTKSDTMPENKRRMQI
jgi:hypothetical protein